MMGLKTIVPPSKIIGDVYFGKTEKGDNYCKIPVFVPASGSYYINCFDNLCKKAQNMKLCKGMRIVAVCNQSQKDHTVQGIEFHQEFLKAQDIDYADEAPKKGTNTVPPKPILDLSEFGGGN